MHYCNESSEERWIESLVITVSIQNLRVTFKNLVVGFRSLNNFPKNMICRSQLAEFLYDYQLLIFFESAFFPFFGRKKWCDKDKKQCQQHYGTRHLKWLSIPWNKCLTNFDNSKLIYYKKMQIHLPNRTKILKAPCSPNLWFRLVSWSWKYLLWRLDIWLKFLLTT